MSEEYPPEPRPAGRQAYLKRARAGAKTWSPRTDAATLQYFATVIQLREEDAAWSAWYLTVYGLTTPGQSRPADFPPGAWARWCRDRPGAINVIAWQEKQGLTRPVEPEAPVVPVEPETAETQLAMF